MTVDVTQQGAALCQAVLLGGALGVLYDLFRVLRVRVRLPLLGGALDLLFWLLATAALFVWSGMAWGGQVRLYGAAFCLLGGGVYFWGVSPWLLRLGYRLADLTAFLLGVFSIPLVLGLRALKKIKKLLKNIFHSGAKWYRIGRKPKEMERAFSRRAAREKGEGSHAVQTGRFFDQNRGAGAADLYGHLSAGPAGTDPERPE